MESTCPGSLLTDAQLAKLPKYGSAEIRRLARDLADAKNRLAAGPEDSDTFADPYSSTPRPLGKGTTVRFGTAEFDGAFTVRYADSRLYVNYGQRSSETHLAVLSQSSNAVQLAGFPDLPRVQSFIAHQVEQAGGDEFQSAEIVREWRG